MTIDVVTLTTQTNVTTVITLASQGPSGSTTGTALVGDVTGTLVTNIVESITGPVGGFEVPMRSYKFGFDGTALDPYGMGFYTYYRTTNTRPNDAFIIAGGAYQNAAATYTRGGGVDIRSGLGTSASHVPGTLECGNGRFWFGGPYGDSYDPTAVNGLTMTLDSERVVSSVELRAPRLIIGGVTGVTDNRYEVVPGATGDSFAFTLEADAPSITAGAGAPVAVEPAGSSYFRSDGTIYTTAGAGVWAAVGGAVTWAQDLAGSTNTSQIAVALTGAAGLTLIRATSPGLVWDAATTDPGLGQLPRTTDVATQPLTIRAQDAWVSSTHGNNNIGGTLNLSSGLSYINETNFNYGVINLQLGGSTILSLLDPNNLTWVPESSPTYSHTQASGVANGLHTTIVAQSGGSTSGDGGHLKLGGGAGDGNGAVWIQSGGVTRAVLDDNGIRFTEDAGTLSAAVVVDITQRAGTGANNGYRLFIEAQKGQQQTGGAANNNGGDVTISGGPAGTGGGGAAGVAGRVSLCHGTAERLRTSPAGSQMLGVVEFGASFAASTAVSKAQILTLQTSNATPTAFATTFTLTNGVHAFDVVLQGRSGTKAFRNNYSIDFGRNSGTSYDVGTITAGTAKTAGTASTWSATITRASDTVTITVTGEAATTIDWTATVQNVIGA